MLVRFAALRCRLGVLTERIDGTTELTPVRVRLDRHLGKARTLVDRAGASCDLAKRGPAKRRLRMTRKRLNRVAKTLREADRPAVTTPLMEAAQTLATDTRALGTALTCP